MLCLTVSSTVFVPYHSPSTPAPELTVLVHPLPSRRARAGVAVAVALLSAAYVLAFAVTNPDFTSDFDQVWGAARALLHRQDPYLVVGPGKSYPWQWPFFYPLSAALIASPLAGLPVIAARVVFAAVSAGLFAYAITWDGFGRSPVFISISFVTAVELVQWSPLLAAGMILPGLGWLAVAKPNLGIAMAAYARTDKGLAVMAAGVVVLFGVSFVVQPTWAREWFDAVRAAPQFRPLITRPAALVMLPVLLRWRRPEARFLAALALVPRTPTFYDHIFVFVAAMTFRESLVLTVGTFTVFFFMAFNAPFRDLNQRMELLTLGTVLFVYGPAVIMVLRRANVGEVPRVVDRWASPLAATLQRVVRVTRA